MVFHCPLYHFMEERHGQGKREKGRFSQAGVSDDTIACDDAIIRMQQQGHIIERGKYGR